MEETPYQRRVLAEFDAWRRRSRSDGAKAEISRPYPAPFEPGWLPDGWVFLVAARAPGDTAFIVRPAAGGWALVRFSGDSGRRLYESEPTLGQLYAQVCSWADSPEPVVRKGWMPVEEALRNFIAAAYDPDDPAESAERMLVALGARPVRMPTAWT